MSAYSSFAYASSTNSPPEIIPSDMEGEHVGKGSGKLESGSCYMAERFYQKYFHEIINFTDRKELGRFFAQVQHELLEDPTPFPEDHRFLELPIGRQYVGGKTLKQLCIHEDSPDGRRHFRQVLYSLSVHGKVCNVFNKGSTIAWKASKPVATKPSVGKITTEGRGEFQSPIPVVATYANAVSQRTDPSKFPTPAEQADFHSDLFNPEVSAKKFIAKYGDSKSLSEEMMCSGDHVTNLDDFLKTLDLEGLTEKQRVEMGCLLTRFYGGIESAEANMLVDVSFDEVRNFIKENRAHLEKGETIAHQEMEESRLVVQQEVDFCGQQVVA